MADEGQAGVEPGVLFLGLTRPPISRITGLPHGLTLILIVAAMETVILTHGFWLAPIVVPIWLIFVALFRNDHNFLHVAGVGIQSKARSVDVWRWGGGSLSPFPIRCTAIRGIIQ